MSDNTPASPPPPEDSESGMPSRNDVSRAGLDPAFLALLCCPLCDDRPFLRLGSDGKTLHCDKAGHTFPIVDGFPDLRPPGETIAPAAPGPDAPSSRA
jgi:uncharacterized protein YbaR (Trm112 family)